MPPSLRHDTADKPGVKGVGVYVCICARVRECEVRAVIAAGARDEIDVGDACGAGTGCGTCLERIDDLLSEHTEHPSASLARAS